MKFAIAIAVMIVILSSFPSIAHVANAGAQAGASVAAGSASAQANNSDSASVRFEPVKCELVSKLDSKSAKAGDAVVVKTTEKLVTAEGSVVPKGARLVGHVTDVQAHGENHADSSMTIAFDRAELKRGQTLAIHSVIESIAPPAVAASAVSVDNEDSMSASMGAGMAASSRPMGVGRNGGGVVGGAAGAATATNSGIASNTGAASDIALQSTAARSTESLAGMGPTASDGLHGGFTAASPGAHATAIPGLMLAGDASGTASGTLYASHRNIHLDSGTQILLLVADAGAAR